MPDHRPSLPRRPQSVWRANPGAPAFAPLDGDRRTGVVVVGAGIAGLSTALQLARAGKEVTVLDAHAVGDGVTGATTAKASLLQGTRYSTIEQRHGAGVTRRYAEAQIAGQAQLRAWAEELAPDARLQIATAYTATTEASSVSTIETEHAAAARAGLDVTLHAGGRDIGLPFETAAAVSLAGQVHFDPVPYLWALARAVEDAGGRVHERSRVTGLAGLDGRGVVTPQGTVEADHVVVTTGIPIFDRAGWFARAFPTRSYCVAVALGEGVTVPMDGYYGTDTPSWSLRAATDPADGRILLVLSGGSHVPGREPHPVAHQKRLAAWADNRFDGVQVRYRWSAQDYETADGLPAWGPMWQLPTRVLVATGFDKWGMTNGTAAGLALAGMVTGEVPEWSGPFHTRRINPAASAKPFVTANAEVGFHLVKDWLTGGATSAPESGPGTPAAEARAGQRTDDVEDAVAEVVLEGHAEPEGARAEADAVVAAAEEAGQLSTDPAGLEDGQGVVIRRGLDRVGVSRVGGRQRAVRAVCTHLGGVLAWNDAECSWDCPLHGSRFDAEGRMLQAPACRDLAPREP